MRTFDDKPAVRERVPLLIGLTGASSSGKTFSALRLATGIQRVVGGEIFVIDTEAKRALHYADKFNFRHLEFLPPFGPLDYLAAIEHCIAKGARVIVIDSMTHEHSGIGGVLDQSEKFLEERAGTDYSKRDKLLMTSLVRPKKQRKELNSRIVQLGINAIFCYRAIDKIKPRTGQEPLKLGWQPETTSPLHYEMTQRFLLEPGSRGVPTLKPDNKAEQLMIKDPEQFRGWFKDGEALSEEIGERMARWAAGDTKPPVYSTALQDVFDEISAAFTREALLELSARVKPKPWNTEQTKLIKGALDARMKEILAQGKGGSETASGPVTSGTASPTGSLDSPWNAEGICKMCYRTQANVKDFGHEKGCQYEVPA